MSTTQILLLNAAVIAVSMLLLWLLSLRLRDASIVDICWGLGFVLIAWATCASVAVGAHPVAPRAFVLATLTTVWGLRLAAYLAWRNHGRGEDPRYRAMRDHHGKSFWWVSLITVFGLQGAVMWLVSLPLQIGPTDSTAMSTLNYCGIAVWGIGFLFESLGDYQLAKFKANADSGGKVMDQGLWRYTRHPNYFGNAMIWWGLFIVSASPATAWLAVSPLSLIHI
mgnify:FL=1